MKKLYLQLFTLMCATLACAQTPVASYPFNGNANDASGTANGTVNGATLTTDRFGKANSAYSFDGINNFIEAAADALPTGDNTVSLWFNADPGSVAGRPGVLGYGGNIIGSCPGNSQILIINLTGQGKYTTQAHCLNNYADYTYAAAPENSWYNWVVTRSGSTIKMYVNGVLVSAAATATQPVIVSGTKLSIGAVVGPNGVANYTDPNVGHFKGKIDDIKIYNTALTDKQVSDNYLSESLVASYPFTGNANDVSGNGNNGIVNGATLTTDRFGNANSAYSFNGTSNWIQVPNSNSLQLGNSAYTLSAWVKPNGYYSGTCQANFVLSKGDNGSGEGHYNLQYGDFLDGSCGAYTPAVENFATSFRKGSSDNSAFTNPATIPVLGRWYQVVGTYDGTSLRLYVNGKLISAQPVTGTLGALNVSDLFIGRHDAGSPNQYWVNGVIDDVKIYSNALTDAQVFDGYINDLRKPGSGNGVLFDNNLIQAINVGSGFDQTGSFSFETWVKRTNTNVTDLNSQTFMASQLNNGWSIGINQSSPQNRIYISKVGITQVVSASSITDTKWHHVAVTYNAGANQVIFYIDGVADAPVAYSPGGFSCGGCTYRIGGRNNGINFDNSLNGTLDEVRVWNNVVLSQTEIRDWMCRKITSLHPQYTNLKGYFRLDEGSGTTTGGFNASFGAFENGPVWQASGAPLGDAASHDFVNTSKTANISHASGENFSVTSTSGSPAGIVVYRVDEQPNTLNGASGVGQNDKYFGVFQSGGTSPQYTAVYNYSGNPFVTPAIESDLRLNKRTDNSNNTWTVMPDLANEPANTITVTGESTEYVLGRLTGILPVNLVTFSTVKDNDKVLLYWNTENEINLQRYEVERSADGRSFKTISTVAAKGNSSNTYTATDNTPVNGINYYRLKIIDKDGTVRYSVILKIDFSKKYPVSILPNPAHDYIIINGADKFKQVRLVDMNGTTVKQFAKNSSSRYSISGIAAGVYLLQFINDDEVQAEKIVIQ